MADIALDGRTARPAAKPVGAWTRLKHNRNWLGLWFMLPAGAILVLFLAYPLSLGVWLSFTDARIGRTRCGSRAATARRTRTAIRECWVRPKAVTQHRSCTFVLGYALTR